jgi:hypothetical protein
MKKKPYNFEKKPKNFINCRVLSVLFLRFIELFDVISVYRGLKQITSKKKIFAIISKFKGGYKKYKNNNLEKKQMN